MTNLLHLTEGHKIDYKSTLDGNYANSLAKKHKGREDSVDGYSLSDYFPHLSSAYSYSIIKNVEHNVGT